MRDSCIGCSCLEDGYHCFWYQSDRRPDLDGCGNSFEEKPEFTQEELEDITYNPKYNTVPTEELDKWAKEGDWDKIYDNVEKCKERFRQEKKGKIVDF